MLDVALTHRLGAFRLDVAFHAGAGVTAILGRSGAGKTTLVNAIAGLITPDQGHIRLDQTDLLDTAKRINRPSHQRNLGYVFQDGRLFPHLNVAQNLEFGLRYAAAPLSRAARAELIDLLGIAPLLNRRPAALSGGEKQRVALGRALFPAPSLLLMDEPLAALDGPRKEEILPYLEQLRDAPGGAVPILYVSHAVDEIARLADRIVLLQQGQVATQGDVFDVLSDPAAVPLIGVREAGSILVATVTDHAPDGLSTLTTSAGALELPGVAAPIGAQVRLRVLAQDVILSRSRPEGLSSVNILPVTVTSIHTGEGPGAAIALSAGQDRLLARLTLRAVRELGLAPGVTCHAIVKATTVARGSIGLTRPTL
ncbi:Molybdenum import ATP-binding protein ModC (plasmid) [Pseudoseohaeicola sp. NH-UV-7]|uniref:molybdenum ABC transporter ATP-binding protein n=1 Tax=Sulfitobacter sp. TBRI5 TaxID=2989732 RepID=UPI003A7684FE